MTADDSSACRPPQAEAVLLLLPKTPKAPAGQTGPRSVGGKSQNTDARPHTSTLPISHTNRLVLQFLNLGSGSWMPVTVPLSLSAPRTPSPSQRG